MQAADEFVTAYGEGEVVSRQQVIAGAEKWGLDAAGSAAFLRVAAGDRWLSTLIQVNFVFD
jgi:hypothetical protein